MLLLRRVAEALPRRVVAALNRAQFRHHALRPILGRLAALVAAGEGTIHRGPGKGLRIDATGRSAGYVLGTSEFEEQLWLTRALRPGDVFWDLGANIGFFTLLGARLVGETGAVVAFEPWPENVEQLRRNVALNGFANVTVEASAVGAASGIGSFALPDDPDARGYASKLLTADGGGQSITVAVTSLDDYAAGPARRPTVIKMDVEGGEINVLRGGLRTIFQARPILLVEVHWLGAAFADFAESELLPLGYAANRLSGEPLPLLPRNRERFHVAFQPQT